MSEKMKKYLVRMPVTVICLTDILKRILWSGQVGEIRGLCRNHRGTVRVHLSHIWLPQDVAGAGETRHPP